MGFLWRAPVHGRGVLILSGVLLGRVVTCRPDRRVPFHVAGAALGLIIVMGVVWCASSPPTLPVTHSYGMMYFLFSTDIRMYFGGGDGGTGLWMTDDGRWRSRRALMTYTTTTHTYPLPSLGRWLSLSRRAYVP